MINTKKRDLRRPIQLMLALTAAISMLLILVVLVGASQFYLAEFPAYFQAVDMAVQSDGKIVVSGYHLDSQYADIVGGALVRLNSDGSLDTSYGSEDMVETSFESARLIAVQSGNRVIVEGEKPNGDSTLERYNLDGSLDTSFNTSVALPFRQIFSMVIQSDDKILLLGSCPLGSTVCDYALSRYNSDGSPDDSFGVNGLSTLDFFGSVAVLSNGKIVVAGHRMDDFAVALYNPDGSLDTSFDGDGLLTTDFAGGTDRALSVAVQSDDKIVVAGVSHQDDTAMDFALARYNQDGSLDTSFADNGLLTTDFNGGDDAIRSLAVQPDGKIVGVGVTNPNPSNVYGSPNDIAMARYLPDGGLDISFGSGGKSQIDLTPGINLCCYNDGANKVALGIDGTIIVQGTTQTPGFEGFSAVLLLFPGDSNQAPELNVVNPNVTIDEGQPATNSGTVSDPNGDGVTLTASVGSVTDNNEGTWSWNYTPDDGPVESQMVTITAEDGNGGETQTSFDITVNNVAPIATFENDGPVYEGQSFTLSLSNPLDPSSIDTHAGFEYAFDCGDGAGYSTFSASSTATCPTPYNQYDDIRTVGGRIRDKDDGVSEYSASVTITNAVPLLASLVLPSDPIQAGTTIQFTAVFTDPIPTPPGPLPEPVPPCYPNCNVLFWDWGDGSTDTIDQATSPTTIAHTYVEAGVYSIALTVTDMDGDATTQTYDYVVVYDPSDGFVTGGGWIDSPVGAYAADPSLSGKATFGFVSKYVKGSSTPTGQTQFQFHMADLNFHSDAYQWLVVAGHKAMFKGTGAVNGAGNFAFMISAIDAKLTPSSDVDLFRIKIWDRDNGDLIVYDNLMGADEDAEPTTALGGGNIVIHNSK